MQRRFPRKASIGFELHSLEIRRVMSGPAGAGDLIPPVVVSSLIEWDTRQAVTFNFSEAIDPASVATTDVFTLNLSTGQSPAAASVSISSDSKTISWIFNSPGALAADGRYRFELKTNVVSDLAGNGLTPNSVLVFGDIFFLGGDTNRDRAVNTLDFNVLAGNFGATGKTFSQGNFNYTGAVDSEDFTILANRYGKTLPQFAPTLSVNLGSGTMFGMDRVEGEMSPNIDLVT